MTKLVRGLALTAGLALAAAGCGGNPLIGSWSSATLLGEAPPMDATAMTTFTFNADQTVGLRATLMASTGANAGCSGTLEILGIRWASPDGAGAMNTVALTGTGMAFDEISGCTDASLNHARRANSEYSNPIDQHGTYTISGNQLTISFTSGSSMPRTMTFTRQ